MAIAFRKLNWLLVATGLFGLAAAAPVARGSVFTVREVHAATDDIDSLSKATQLLGGSLAVSSETDGSTLTLNYFDPQAPSSGRFGDVVPTPVNVPFPGDTQADDDNFALLATANVVIPAAGEWTFGANADNGVRVQVGSFVMSRSGFDTSALLQTFTFPSAGTYPLALTYYEHTSEAGVELFAAPGTITDGTDPSLRLVGDAAGGGLSIAPEPTGILPLTLLATLLVAHRRRTV